MSNNLGMMAGMMEACEMLDEVSTNESDGLFGLETAWRPGARFQAVIVKKSSTEQKIAERRDKKEIFDVAVERDVPMRYGGAFRRVADGQAFRVTSTPVKSPAMSTVAIASMTAELWEVPRWATP